MSDIKDQVPSRYFKGNDKDKFAQALELCDHLIKDYGARADRAKKRYKTYRYASIFLSTLVTILAFFNLAFRGNGFLFIVIPIVSTISVFCTTILGLTNAQRDWISSRTATKTLQAERFLYSQKAGKYDVKSKEQRLKVFSHELASLWNEIHEEWQNTKLNN